MQNSLTSNNSSLLAGSSNSIFGGHSGTSTTTIGTPYGLGIAPSIQYLTVKNNQMRQVKVALFNVVRDSENNNNITDSTFVEEFWVKQKGDISLELATMIHLGRLIDPDKEVIREIYSIYL